MNTNLECLVQLSRLWWTWVWHSSWQSALVTGLVLGALAQGKRWNAPLRYAILLVALLKFAVPPLLPLPTGVFTWAARAVHPSEQGAVGIAPDWRPAGESFSQRAEFARGESERRIRCGRTHIAEGWRGWLACCGELGAKFNALAA
jgi:hypothetical protein